MGPFFWSLMTPFFRITIAVIVLIVISAATIANAANTATISFQAPTQYTDGSSIAPGTAISYRVFQGLKGAEKALVGTITETSQTISSGLQGGAEYCWQVSVVVNGRESVRSNEVCKAFEFPTPETVTITVT